MWMQRTDPTVKRWLALDPDAFYVLVKAHDGISAEGTTGRAAMDTALRYGVPVKGNRRCATALRATGGCRSP